jgi:hypothetical protein
MLGEVQVNGKIHFVAKTKKADIVNLTPGEFVISSFPLPDLEEKIEWKIREEFLEEYEPCGYINLRRLRGFERALNESLGDYPPSPKIGDVFHFKNMEELREFSEEDFKRLIGFGVEPTEEGR